MILSCYQFQFQIFRLTFSEVSYHIKVCNNEVRSKVRKGQQGGEGEQGEGGGGGGGGSRGAWGGAVDHQRDGERHHRLQASLQRVTSWILPTSKIFIYNRDKIILMSRCHDGVQILRDRSERGDDTTKGQHGTSDQGDPCNANFRICWPP